MPSSKKKGTLTSFFWHAAPPQFIVLIVPGTPVSTREGAQAQEKHFRGALPSKGLVSYFW
ncbi:MAG: hypothetical protein M1832_001757 [Thelocarpon impressellum]|nr:MAG: hypothetical protein M1832_001757 [Thelocarpon impressellum]